jgi:hypothetical protein
MRLIDRHVVSLAAEQREPARLRDYQIEMVAVNDQIAPAVRAQMDRVLDNLDAAEMRAVIIAQEFVVIARHIDDARAFARLAQKFLHHVVVALRPAPSGLELPAIDDVADEVDHLGIVVTEKVEQAAGLTTLCAKVHVGDEERAKSRAVVRHSAAMLSRIDMNDG